MSATRIVKICQAWQLELFADLMWETVKGWIDRSGKRPKWHEETLCQAEAGNEPGHAMGEPQGVLVRILSMKIGWGTNHAQTGYPHVVDTIKKCLTDLRNAGVPLTLITVWGVDGDDHSNATRHPTTQVQRQLYILGIGFVHVIMVAQCHVMVSKKGYLSSSKAAHKLGGIMWEISLAKSLSNKGMQHTGWTLCQSRPDTEAICIRWQADICSNWC
jgi:hypothetical protein